MKNESQYGLLLLQRYLYEHTDDQHPASVADILAFWQECGIQAGRKSVYSAIEVSHNSSTVHRSSGYIPNIFRTYSAGSKSGLQTAA